MKDQQDTGQLALGLRDGARRCGLGENALFTAIREGRGPRTLKIGRRHLVRVAELDLWLQSMEQGEKRGGDE